MKRYIYFSIVLSIFLLVWGHSNNVRSMPQTAQNPLHIPELVDSRTTPEIRLVMQKGAHEFYSGVPSETKGFNGDYLGPTIRLYKDTDATITFINNIGEPTTVHGHGLHVSGDIDGGPQSSIQPGESWQITIPVRQEAGTSWYHPHLMGKTAHHAHAGLAGLYLIEDENSQALDLPKEYGVNDVPLVVQDRSFTDGKMHAYAVTDQEIKDGLREDTLVVNGTVDAYHVVPQGWVRLRLLNGSNARFYRFSFSNNAPFFKIATEGGFLNQPVEMTSIDMAPGERNEIMIDVSSGSNATLIADLLPADPEDVGLWSRNTPQLPVVELRVDPTMQTSGTLPGTLNDIAYFDRADATQIRTISLDMEVRNGNNGRRRTMMGINGRSMDMGFINERVKQGDVEIWRITGQRMPHSFHIHGASFQILTLNGVPPSEADRGWKDTVVVWDNVTEIIVRFDYHATEEYPFMYHCHMFEHEEAGMMGQFTVE
jgi:bilirubin oxidase